MTKLQKEALRSAEDSCLGAVSYVGAANYIERELEARQQVTQTFETLRKIFGSTSPKIKPEELDRLMQGSQNG